MLVRAISNQKNSMVPVMLKEVIEYLNIKEDWNLCRWFTWMGWITQQKSFQILAMKTYWFRARDAEVHSKLQKRFSASACPII